ncbi:S-adenosyl-L-methionine-dependent methyltransferase [Chaetomium strumarium]|uniref:S-adenosyl-L-methionine-dependent methyltransferase n=1 Tax=Chaetomium strumarium TaxID=1170767 RepID=A0AAJ0LXV1_9PEZI|nr:S-adenosyl-L-methionine-dependent methyltransferase [Chaetomium strumarium]
MTNKTTQPPIQTQGPTTPPTTTAAAKETTFRSFSRAQGASYAQHRLDYHPRLYQLVLDHHNATGGRLDTLLDVGCGPGTAVRTLAPHFAHALGIDPSEGMIATARSLGGYCCSGSGSTPEKKEPIRFEVSTVEELEMGISRDGTGIQEGSVDLLVAATAAHWFDMSVFWPLAARLLRPGGTVALWTGGRILVDADQRCGSVPNNNAKAIQVALDRFDAAVDEYFLPGNRMVSNLYADLQLPWMLERPVAEFERDGFVRKLWDNGTTSSGGGTEDGEKGEGYIKEFYTGDQKGADVEVLVKILATTSPYIRWREANADAVDTDKDPLQVMRREIELALEQGGVGGGKRLVKGGVAGVLLMVKKRAQAAE